MMMLLLLQSLTFCNDCENNDGNYFIGYDKSKPINGGDAGNEKHDDNDGCEDYDDDGDDEKEGEG